MSDIYENRFEGILTPNESETNTDAFVNPSALR